MLNVVPVPWIEMEIFPAHAFVVIMDTASREPASRVQHRIPGPSVLEGRREIVLCSDMTGVPTGTRDGLLEIERDTERGVHGIVVSRHDIEQTDTTEVSDGVLAE